MKPKLYRVTATFPGVDVWTFIETKGDSIEVTAAATDKPTVKIESVES